MEGKNFKPANDDAIDLFPRGAMVLLLCMKTSLCIACNDVMVQYQSNVPLIGAYVARY